MQKLIAELMRLYLPAGAVPPDVLALHALGQQHLEVSLTGADGLTRAFMIPFRKGEQAWEQLCDVANALQQELGLPAPAVSISGDDAYGLWLSFEPAQPAAQAQALLERLRDRYFPDTDLPGDAVRRPVALPPCVHPRSGKWSAFIHPGMGASFADEPGLDMAPPPHGQVTFLEKLESVNAEQFGHAMAVLGPGQPVVQQAVAMPGATSAQATGLLLKDATLEDIVRHLHALNIEPTFRHLIAPLTR